MLSVQNKLAGRINRIVINGSIKLRPSIAMFVVFRSRTPSLKNVSHMRKIEIFKNVARSASMTANFNPWEPLSPISMYGLKNKAADMTFNFCSSREILIKVDVESLGADKVKPFHNFVLAGRNSRLIRS